MPSSYSGRARQSGVALMLVILVFALVSILAAGIYKRQKLFIYTAGSLVTNAQAYQYALGSETYARRLLLEDWREDKKNNEFVDDLEQVENALFLPVDDALLEAQFNDLHGRINLNDLVYVDGIPNPIMSERFKRLLDRLALDDVKLERIQDWIDENQDATGIEGVEDGEYLSLEPPYRTGGQVFSHPSELMLIEGVDRESYEALLPFVTTLPQGLAHINVNTASAEVLQSLVENLPDNVAEELASKAKESPWKSIQEFAAEPLLKGLKLDTTYLDVASNFYELATRITLSDRKVRLRSILYRAKEDGSVTLLQRDQGQKYLITKSGV
ncbi:hypothetical protein A3742_04275 [Oleiphilus sp. HI0071]|nr:hypothetical protein A3737_00250 [Oleiphilus sp. HI0065]KZY78883.1 hypothetical protein A3742_22420 [Oleiphilus sp. HI0071]KZY91358.1 hypothetical protein A3744_05465 [Oleiphilus sp. HI0073]KZZ13259.1 hypothetical protein A3750_03945 [Oleiphilus sp. HI0079]KZZ17190.1 hypothetical protein A3751_01915 [Oleiphilus sp. HI0080]KZZ42394.1 hypothetical protein A3758_07110 [Oleiphilus sp. HI0118]KZZ48864.1 hypothetical protein A3760_22600 [Oleiphilus sp. HI0122]KZZ64613.1 hypothetical protein A37